MDADDQERTLTTRPLRFTGSRLFVNVAAPSGALRVAVLDTRGQTLKGFSATDCKPLQGDKTKLPVTWGKADLSAVTGRSAVKLRFHLRNGNLYSFWVSRDASGASRGYVAAGGPGFDTATDIGRV